MNNLEESMGIGDRVVNNNQGRQIWGAMKADTDCLLIRVWDLELDRVRSPGAVCGYAGYQPL